MIVSGLNALILPLISTPICIHFLQKKDLLNVPGLISNKKTKSLYERLNIEISRAIRHRLRVGIVVVQLTNSKMIPSEVEEIVNNNKRPYDIVGVYESNKILMFYTHLTVDSLDIIKDRVKILIENATNEMVTIGGVECVPEKDRTFNDLLENAVNNLKYIGE